MGRYRFEVIDFVETPLGVLDLRRRELPGRDGHLVTEVMINGDLLMSSEETVSERRLTTSALARHAGTGGLRVLVGGLGLGYTAHAVLSDPRVEHVRVMDLLPQVYQWLRAGHMPLSDKLNHEPRFEFVEDDVYQRLLGAADERYDVILIDVDHAPKNRLDNSSAPFYTGDGQRAVARHLQPGGVLAVWSADDDDDFARVLDEVYPWARREHVTWENHDCDEIVDTLFLAQA